MTGAPERLSAALAARYRVERELGAGGMATVYLAEDLRHRRQVALKVLRPELAAILGVERFLREIEVTANLQHPNILPLYDSGEADSYLFYVMPHVPGESLRDRLARVTQLSVDEAVTIARSVAGALDFAHRRGVIHRDIKPENILLSDGQALVADFGIALAVSSAGGTRMTETGMSLGTPHYMSPEQATGDRVLDARSDVYSLGATTYEMLVGEPPFTGPTAQAILSKVVTTQATPPSDLRRSVPPHVDAAVRTALEKLPADRFATAAEFAAALANPGFTLHTRLPGRAVDATPPSRRSPLLVAAPWVLATMALIGAAAALARRGPTSPPAMQFTIALPAGVSLPMDTEHPVLALAPDGSRLVFVGEERGIRRLYIRDLAQRDSRPIGGTEGAAGPMFSPDGRWLAFFDGSLLKKVSLDGGVPIAVHSVWGIGVNRGAAWNTDETVVIAGSANSGLARISVAGERLRAIDEQNSLTSGSEPYAWPDAIPGGRHVVFADLAGRTPDAARVSLLNSGSGEVTRLATGGTSPRYSPTGHILFARDGALFAVPFDPGRANTRGAEQRLLDGVVTESWGAAHFTVAANGTLAYVAGGTTHVEHELVWVSRSGAVETLLDVGRTFFDVRLSPDGTRLAFSSPDGANYDIWVLDLTRRGALSRLTSHPGEDLQPVWSVSGDTLALASEIGEDAGELGPGLAWITRAGGRPEQLLPTPSPSHLEFPSSWSPDGRWLAFTAERPRVPTDILVLPTTGAREPRELIATPGNKWAAMFSPDGHWIAYVSDVSGEPEVYLTAFPATGEAIRISTNGGVEPRWARSGSELFYREGDRLMSVKPRAGQWKSPGAPEVLFYGRFEQSRWGGLVANYDVSIDAQRFVMVRRKNPLTPTVVHVVVNWPQALGGSR